MPAKKQLKVARLVHPNYKLYYKGVKVYSLENLHAKIYVVGNTLLIGSANVSGNSSKLLQEAIIKTNDKQAVNDAKAFIEGHCHIELGEEQLTRLQRLYRPPRFTGVKNAKLKKAKRKTSSQPSFLVYKLTLGKWTGEENQKLTRDVKRQKKYRVHKSRHTVEEFKFTGKIVAKKSDIVMQIIDEGNQVYVSPWYLDSCSEME